MLERPLIDDKDRHYFEQHRLTTNNAVPDTQRSLMTGNFNSARGNAVPFAKPANAPLAQKVIKRDKKQHSYMQDTDASRKKILPTQFKNKMKDGSEVKPTYREKAKQEAQKFFSPDKDPKEFLNLQKVRSLEFDGADEPVGVEAPIDIAIMSPRRQSGYMQNKGDTMDPPPITDRSTS